MLKLCKYKQLKSKNVSDLQVLSDLLNQISSDECIDYTYTDEVYNTKLCRQAISYHHVYAVISPRKSKAMER